MNTVKINGLLWDKENTIICGIEHFTQYQAEIAAKELGKRLPTKEEWEALFALGYIWDRKKNGIWVGIDHQLKEKSEQSIFLPAFGYLDSSTGALCNRGGSGYYWSSAQYRSSTAYYVGVNSGGQSTGSTGNSYGFSVRCVAE